MKHPIPTAALDDRLAFVGVTGSGKTYNAGGTVERLLERRARVVIPDPLGVWWGLRLLADGKTQSGYDVVIFGGPHGDLPLTEHAGALIGETVAGMQESCILDLSQLGTKATERRFMLAFLTGLYKHTPGEPVHVVFDEADMWAPQRLFDKEGEAAKLLGMMETVVRRGRVKGFIPWLISQRPAVISKDVLSQVDGLIAFKLTSVQDRDAIGDWVEGQADRKQWNAIFAQLPTMERGQGVVWLPARSILDTVQFQVKGTFDSSRTPKRGEKKTRTAALKPLNLGNLKDRLATVEAEAKASDPKALRADIAKLKAEKAALEKQVAGAAGKKPAADPGAIAEAEKRGFERAKNELTKAAEREAAARVMKMVDDLRGLVTPMSELLDHVHKEARRSRPDLKSQVVFTAPRPAPASLAHSAPAAPRPSAVSGDGSYTRPQMRVLESLAMWRALGHDTPSREMVAAVAGYSPTSGGFNNLIGGLGPKAMGAIGIPTPGNVSLLVDGIGVISKEEGRDLLVSTLSNPQRKIVAVLIDCGVNTRDEVGEATGYSPSSGGFNNLLGSLNTLGITRIPQPGHVALSDWAQELLSGHAERIAA